ncbi:MAG TPA: M48 family metallopeptidase [Vicinamibacterales bacterium]|jgi:STE24 endopeptidase|nr:M48 family metallopeptidase [Vicinamibacterales bacterium]
MVLSFVCAMALAAGSAGVQPPPPTSPPPGTTDAFRIQAMVLEDETAPVAVPEPSEQAMRYYRSGNVLWFVEQAWSIAVLVLLLATGLSASLRNAARRIGRNWFFTIVVYFALFTVVTTIVDLPLSYYTEYVREHAYGLSNQTFGKWFGDTLKSLAVACIVGALVMWVPYLLLRKSPRRWWLYTAIALVPFIVLANLVAPIWIAPLFNKFEPMQDKALEQKILSLAGRAGIEGSRVYQVNKSVDTKTLNAYVAGLFGTKRIVLWDTTLKRMTDRELLFVMGHEMGHYVLHHVWQAIAFSVVIIAASLYVAYRTAGAVIARFGRRWGFTSLADVASLPLLLLLMSAFGLVVTPLQLAFTRHLEHEADRFGLEITQTNHSAGTAFVKLQQDALANPRPGLLYKIFRESHPPLGERIDFANQYHPWTTDQPLEYGGKFKP